MRQHRKPIPVTIERYYRINGSLGDRFLLRLTTSPDAPALFVAAP